jgi:chitooligosaccharide deacetylase
MRKADIMGAPVLHWIFRGAVTAAAAGGGVAVLSASWPLPLRLVLLALLVAAGVMLAFRFLPAFDPFGRVRWRLPRSADGIRRCALTFDDGPGPATNQVLDILQAEDVPATFFVLGTNAVRHPDAVRRLQAEGHAIGLHGASHRKLAGAGVAEVERQLDGVAAVLEGLGVTPSKVYRTPHGFKSRAVFDAAGRRRLTVWAWSRGVWDTARPAADVLVRRATRLARSGMVLLLHDGRGEDPQPDVSAMLAALPGIIRTLKARGFTFVRLTDAAMHDGG